MTPSLIDRLREAKGADRFWSKVDRGNPDECWPWRASVSQKGYGQFSLGVRGDGSYRMLRAHRVAYVLERGSFNGDLDHLCRNKRCCNPAHLEPVTAAENNKREALRNLSCKRGHEFTRDNTFEGKNGTRECRACRLARKRRYRIAALEARAAMAAHTNPGASHD